MNKTILGNRSSAYINKRQEQVLVLGEKYLEGLTYVSSTLKTREKEGGGATRCFCLQKDKNKFGV